MRRPQVGELIKQIAVGPYFVPRHLPVCEDSQEGIGGIVGECPAIGREGRRASGVIGQHVRQQCSRHTPCFRRRIPTRVFQRVCEDGDETGIVYRLTREVGISLPADKKDGLRGQRAAIRLDPTPARAVQRAGPQVNPSRSKDRVGHLQHDAAHVFVGEEVVTGELQIVQGPLRVEEKGIAPPAREEAVAASLRHACIPTS